MPQEQTIIEPSSAIFTCSAEGIPSPNILWYRIYNGSSMLIKSSQKYNISDDNMGLTNRTSILTILNTTPNDANIFICNATNVLGSTHTNFTLFVKGIK